MKSTLQVAVKWLRERRQLVAACLPRNTGSRRLVMTRLAGTAAVAMCLMLIASVQPFTFFYAAVHDKDALTRVATDLNHRRIDAAMEYFRRLPKRSEEELRKASNASAFGSSSSSSSSPTSSTPSQRRFTIVVITVSRKKPEKSDRNVGYVLQSTAALDYAVRAHDHFRDSFLFVCNVDPNPQGHQDAAVLKDYLPYVERYGKSVLPFQTPTTTAPSGKTLNSYDIERSDYAFCLQVASNFPSEHYIVFQDDAVPHPDFPAVLELSLSKLAKHQTCRTHFQQSGNAGSGGGGGGGGGDNPMHSVSSFLPDPREEASCFSQRPPYTVHARPQEPRPVSPSPDVSFGYLKFFFPERWQGFAFEPLRILDLLSYAFVGGGLGLLLRAAYTCLAVRGSPSSAPPRRLAPFLLGIALSLLLAQLAGRQNLNELRRLSKFLYRLQQSPDCCAPAVLYPAPVLPHLTKWLLESPSDSKVDLRISGLFHHLRIPTYSIEPNLVRHVGMITSLKDKSYEKPVEEFLLFR